MWLPGLYKVSLEGRRRDWRGGGAWILDTKTPSRVDSGSWLTGWGGGGGGGGLLTGTDPSSKGECTKHCRCWYSVERKLTPGYPMSTMHKRLLIFFLFFCFPLFRVYSLLLLVCCYFLLFLFCLFVVVAVFWRGSFCLCVCWLILFWFVVVCCCFSKWKGIVNITIRFCL